MTTPQMGGAIALAVIGAFFIIISAMSRGFDDHENGSFGERLSRGGLMVGGLFMLPLIILVITGIVAGFPS